MLNWRFFQYDNSTFSRGSNPAFHFCQPRPFENIPESGCFVLAENFFLVKTTTIVFCAEFETTIPGIERQVQILCSRMAQHVLADFLENPEHHQFMIFTQVR